MKKAIIFLFVVLALNRVSSQSCLPEGIEFNRQSQIDSFRINYPDCEKIKGNVTIMGTDITNLGGLKFISAFGGDLNIHDNPKLTSLTGLSSVKSVRSTLSIINNPLLINLTGLDSLSFTGGDLNISFCSGLADITALKTLRSTGGGLIIYEDNSLEDLLGLELLSNVGYCLLINGNMALVSLDGLAALDTIWGNLWIVGNPNLENISGLNHLTTLCGQLSISANARLASLRGLDNINSPTISNLYICDNDSLSACEVLSICNYLANPVGRIEIHNNAPGCKNREEIAAACAEMPVDNLTPEDGFSVFPSPAQGIITIGSGTRGVLTMTNIRGVQFISCPITEPKTQIDVSNLPGGVYFIRLAGRRALMTGKVIKQ